MTIIVTGGAGFIGSNFVFHMLKDHPDYRSGKYQNYYEKMYANR